MTDGTVLDSVEFPEKEEHVHSFGDLMDFGNNEGLTCDKKMYYKVCSECFEVTFVGGNDASHSYNDTYSYDKSYHWLACANCSATKNNETHFIEDSGKCTVCNNQITPTKGVVYALSSDRTYAEVIDYTGSATDVVIAEEYEGVPVTTIGSYAFSGKNITSINIPAGIVSIGQDAFYNCYQLEKVYINDLAAWCKIPFQSYSVTSVCYSNPIYYAEELYVDGELVTDLIIPYGVTSIESYSFYGCTGITSVTIPDSVTSIDWYAFAGCSNLTDIDIPDSVASIGRWAFEGCYNLGEKIGGVTYIDDIAIAFDDSVASVELRQGTRVISDGAFDDSNKLRIITIPNSVTSIGFAAFSDCDSLTNIVIPDSVTSLGEHVFSGCDSLTNIVIPDSVTSIDEYTFANCNNLASVVIPNSITSIGERAFYGCYSLETIYYTGTQQEWVNINISDWENDCLERATKIYNHIP